MQDKKSSVQIVAASLMGKIRFIRPVFHNGMWHFFKSNQCPLHYVKLAVQSNKFPSKVFSNIYIDVYYRAGDRRKYSILFGFN